jgi:hypothetical protein
MSPVAGRWFALWMCLLAFAGRLVVDIWVRPFAMGIEPTVPSLLITVAAVTARDTRRRSPRWLPTG